MLVWTKAPFLLRSEPVAADGLDGRRPANPDEVEHVGDHPVVIRVRAGDATVEIGARREDSGLFLRPQGIADSAGRA